MTTCQHSIQPASRLALISRNGKKEGWEGRRCHRDIPRTAEESGIISGQPGLQDKKRDQGKEEEEDENGRLPPGI